MSIGTHDEALETQADRDRAEKANREAAACLREWDRRRLREQAQADAVLTHRQSDPFAALHAKLDRVIAMLQRHGITDEPEYPRIP